MSGVELPGGVLALPPEVEAIVIEESRTRDEWGISTRKIARRILALRPATPEASVASGPPRVDLSALNHDLLGAAHAPDGNRAQMFPAILKRHLGPLLNPGAYPTEAEGAADNAAFNPLATPEAPADLALVDAQALPADVEAIVRRAGEAYDGGESCDFAMREVATGVLALLAARAPVAGGVDRGALLGALASAAYGESRGLFEWHDRMAAIVDRYLGPAVEAPPIDLAAAMAASVPASGPAEAAAYRAYCEQVEAARAEGERIGEARVLAAIEGHATAAAEQYAAAQREAHASDGRRRAAEQLVKTVRGLLAKEGGQ